MMNKLKISLVKVSFTVISLFVISCFSDSNNDQDDSGMAFKQTLENYGKAESTEERKKILEEFKVENFSKDNSNTKDSSTSVADDNKKLDLRRDYDYEKFKKTFDQEMSKLTILSQGKDSNETYLKKRDKIQMFDFFTKENIAVAALSVYYKTEINNIIMNTSTMDYSVLDSSGQKKIGEIMILEERNKIVVKEKFSNTLVLDTMKSDLEIEYTMSWDVLTEYRSNETEPLNTFLRINQDVIRLEEKSTSITRQTHEFHKKGDLMIRPKVLSKNR